MLGKFLELSLHAPNTSAAWEQFRQLGFTSAEAGDVFAHAYGVVACDNFAIGLHAKQDEPLCISFVKPDVAALHRTLTDRQYEIEFARLGNDSFNLLALRDPSGTLLKVLEARSFSPPMEPPEATALGRCRGVTLPCRDLTVAAQFWEALGIPGSPLVEPWEGWRIDSLPIRYHSRRLLQEPALIFERETPLDATQARDCGLVATRLSPAMDPAATQLFHTHDELAVVTLVNRIQT